MDDLPCRVGRIAEDDAVAGRAFHDLASAEVDHDVAVVARGTFAGADDIAGGRLADIRADIDAAGIGARIVAPLVGVDKVFSHETVFIQHMVYEPGTVGLAARYQPLEPETGGVVICDGRGVVHLAHKVSGVSQHVVDKGSVSLGRDVEGHVAVRALCPGVGNSGRHVRAAVPDNLSGRSGGGTGAARRRVSGDKHAA